MWISPVTVLITLGNRKFYNHLKYKTQLSVPSLLTSFTLRRSSLLSWPAQLAVLKGRGRCGPSLLPTPHTLPPSWVTDPSAIEARGRGGKPFLTWGSLSRDNPPPRPGGTAVCSCRTPSEHTFQNPGRPFLLQAEDPPAHHRQCFSSRSLVSLQNPLIPSSQDSKGPWLLPRLQRGSPPPPSAPLRQASGSSP